MKNKKKREQQVKQPTLILFIANHINADDKKEEIFKTGKKKPDEQALSTQYQKKRFLKGDKSRFCSHSFNMHFY